MKTLAIIVYVLTGLIGTVLSVMFISEQFGGNWAIIGFIFFPVAFALYPIYLALFKGVWLLVIVNYGGLVISYIFYSLSRDKY